MSSLLVARVRRLRHRPALRWLVVLGLAAVTGLFTTRVVDSARLARDRWGAGQPVVVMVHPVTAGDRIGATDVEVRPLPPAARPPTAITEPPIGRVAVADLYAGEVLIEERVAPEGLQGAAALLPRGARALAVPSGPGTPPLHVGDTVDVLATYDPFLFDPAAMPTATSDFAGAGDVVVAGALVIDVSEGAVTVAVEPDEAPEVAFALAQGAVTLALAG